ncbi:hypothetical protein Rs2_38840 [Raphanus sativus]|nr:hypothetical protein Rs2_38840 [Raphanus sativus]
MVDHCMVIPGEWTSVGSLWEFAIDKKKMSRIVPVRAGMSLLQLQKNVEKEFFTFTDPPPASVLSYWPPNTKELATGLTTPPVILTNDGGVSYFFHHLALHESMNLYVTFDRKGDNPTPTSSFQSPPNVATPNQPNFNTFRNPSSISSKIPSFSLFDEDELSQDLPPNPPNQNLPLHPEDPCPLSPSLKPNRISLQDETLACGDEMLEEMFKDDPDNIPDSWLLEDDEDSGPDNSQPADTDQVPVGGYDHDFWDPLLDQTLGGSNVEEVMAGINVPKTRPETYECTTGDAFAHTVRLSGEDDTEWKKDLDFLGVHQRECPPRQTGEASTRTRRQDPQTPNARVQRGSPSTRTPPSSVRRQQASTRTPNSASSSSNRPSVAVGQSPPVQPPTWIDTYAGVIFPEAPFGDIPIPPAINELNLQPPFTSRPPGRPRDKRKASIGEIQVWSLWSNWTQQDKLCCADLIVGEFYIHRGTHQKVSIWTILKPNMYTKACRNVYSLGTHPVNSIVSTCTLLLPNVLTNYYYADNLTVCTQISVHMNNSTAATSVGGHELVSTGTLLQHPLYAVWGRQR